MIKRVLLIFVFLLMQVTSCFAATQIKVIAQTDFQTEKPSQYLDVLVPEESELGGYILGVNSTLHCKVIGIVDPKRGKRNASFYVMPLYYNYEGNKYNIAEEMYGKYSKFVLSKSELKKIPPLKVIKKAGLAVGNYFVKGLSVAYSFTEGVVKNEDDNRLKSGVVNAYEESPLSYISAGEQLDIKVGDEFYLVFKG